MIFVLLVLLLVSQSPTLCRSQCLRCQQTSCDCSRQNLSEVPVAPAQLLTELDLSFNQLKTINADDFLAYASLKSLIMSNNRIQRILGEAFVPLVNLQKLDLSSNQLSTLLSSWFKNLFSLQYLNLLGNKYTTLGQDNLFQPLKSLKSLQFGGPSLQSVRDGDFSGLSDLEELVLDGRNLRAYTKGSLRQIGPISRVTLGLNYMFQRNQAQVRAILSDVVHPNTTLTFTDTTFSAIQQMGPFKDAFNLGTTSLIFKRVDMSAAACIILLNLLSASDVTTLALEDARFFLSREILFSGPLDLNRLEVVFFKNVDIALFYQFPALDFLQPQLNVVRRATVINSMVFAIPCNSSNYLTALEFLDISDNLINDLTLKEMMCYGHGVLWSLQTLNISRNHLQEINSLLFTKLEKLENIDLSGNKFQNMPETCYWPANLHFLNLSSTDLTHVTSCLPGSLRILDLSKAKLSVFNIELPLLTDLYLSGNQIISLPDGRLFPHLTFFSIKHNHLLTLSSKGIEEYKELQSLEAGGNPFICSCDFIDFMTSDLTNYRVTDRVEFRSYICDSPDAVRGKNVVDVRLSVFECHMALAFSLLCLGLLALCLLIAGLCYKFSVVWYVRMTWAWLKAKRKPKLKKGVLEYDAFVSYSEMDSPWVDAHLVPALEQSEPPLRLCLHKRDFVPGGWILDNIMDAIEKSHRTLFILSQHFVRSEWCKYELDYTHFRLFDQNDDAVVLILLEPIDKKNIPKKFCRLRRVMNSRTYLEWPADDNEIPVFWQSLRAAVTRPEAVNENQVREEQL